MKIKTIEHEDRFEIIVTIPKDMKPIIHDKVLEILRRTSHDTMISQLDILGKCREMDIVNARHMFWFRLHNELGLSGNKIARELGRDTSTVNKALRNYSPNDLPKHN